MSSSYFFEVESRFADKGVELLERHLERYPDNPLASVMHMRLNIWYFGGPPGFREKRSCMQCDSESCE